MRLALVVRLPLNAKNYKLKNKRKMNIEIKFRAWVDKAMIKELETINLKLSK